MAKGAPSLLARGFFILLGLVMLGAAWAWPQLPQQGAARIEVEPGLVGVLLGGYSYAWVLKTPQGAVLVDAGMDTQGKELLAELAAQGVSPEKVHTVLLTHGHVDHWGAAHLFPNARVVVGPGEAAVIRGEFVQKSLVGRLTRSMARPPVPAKLEEAQDGAELSVDGASIRVIHLPGHTPGSAAYLWRDVLFTGDSLLRTKSGLGPSPVPVSEDRKQNLASLRKLEEVHFARVADGHAGLTQGAKEKLGALLK
ncbi:MBL fold metallo-hydrolase [Hyalangium rubrum]|uniref:MBL fold metallo-hydrolase n=1 Tax=Hyalangium rubrum TaxID=3103134 RepID=A0ABU5H6Q8_9BACT|nr:MBL fold metallo-hydrolase [Hyalangium sp. s54d21]MDY7229160.1 MBL fold metallo-hydrolase [Hyalangium sp. s54d21]